MADLLNKVQVGGDDFLIPLTQRETDNELSNNSAETPPDQEKAELQQGIVAGEHNGDYSLGIQRSNHETYRVGGFIDADGDISATFEYLRDSANEQKIDEDIETDPDNSEQDIKEFEVKENSHYYGVALNLSTDSKENSLVASAGSKNYFGDEDQYEFTAKAGVGAFGANAEIKAAVGMEIEREMQNKVTSVFASAMHEYSSNDSEYELRAGVRHAGIELGAKHSEHTDQPEAYVGFTQKL